MEVLPILFIIGIIVIFLGLESYQKCGLWPIARPMIRATWPMGPEGFRNMTLQGWLPSPEVVSVPSTKDCPGTVMNAAKYEQGLALNNSDLLSDVLQPTHPNTIAKGPTAAKCYGIDYTHTLEKSSYAQRTNNYIHKRPETCNGLNQDLILGFYR